jgi:hypothetical protein
MNLDEVYFWETEKIEGYTTRRKYHVFICPKDDDEGHTFLFINSMDWFKDYRLLKSSYSFLSYDCSIGCNTVVTYTDDELSKVRPQLVGQLSVPDMKGLRDAIIGAETMERRHLNRVCTVLAVIL